MNCVYCGYFHEHQTEFCARCAAKLPASLCSDCGIDIGWGTTRCEPCDGARREADQVPCPSCDAQNAVSSEYCTTCGTPMAIITQFMTLARAKDREPLETWRVYGIETEVVGREPELERLDDAFANVQADQKVRLVQVTGSTGLGKSRLLAEFRDRVNQRMTSAHVSHAASRDEAAAPYSMFARLIRDRFYIGENAHPEHARRKLVDAVTHLLGNDKDSERTAHLLGVLINIHFEDSPYLPSIRDSEGAVELDRRCFEALAKVMVADADSAPLVVILEDLQYATKRSIDLIRYLAKHLDDSQILVILSWTPDDLASDRGLSELDYSDKISLVPLSDDEVDRFVRSTLRKADDVPDRLVARVTESAHGNPLIVEEILRVLISQGIVDTRRTTWVIDEERFDDLTLPKSMAGVVQARISALTDDELLVLNMAATVGDVFWPDLIRCLHRLTHSSELPQPQDSAAQDARCESLLESLERKDMIRRIDESMLATIDAMTFKHRIERAAIYDAVRSQDKQRYHRLIAQWLDHRLAPDDEQHAFVVASHFDKARALDRAATKYIDAARFAKQSYQNSRAIELYAKGLSYLSDADIDQKIDAFCDLGDIYQLTGEYDQALSYFQEMLRYTWLLDDQLRGADAYLHLSNAHASLGQFDIALEELRHALTLFQRNSDRSGIARTLDQTGVIHLIRGNFDEAAEHYEAALQLRRELGSKSDLAQSLSHLGGLKLNRGDLKGAMANFREALAHRKEIGDKQGVIGSYNNLAVLCLQRGQTEQALQLFRDALDISRQIGYRGSESVVLSNIGETYLNSGEVDQALKFLRQAADIAEVSGDKRVLFDISRNLGKAALRKSDRDAAVRYINDALKIANELDSPLLVGLGMHSLADAHAYFGTEHDDSLGNNPLAEECYQDAVAILDEVGSESDLALAMASYGKFLARRGDVADGRETLSRAREIFDRIELTELRDSTDQLLESL